MYEYDLKTCCILHLLLQYSLVMTCMKTRNMYLTFLNKKSCSIFTVILYL